MGNREQPMTHIEYTKRLEEILDDCFEAEPAGYFDYEKAITAIQQLNNEAIGEDVPLHQPFDDKYDYVEMGGWTIFRKGVNWYKQELRNILGASND